MTALPNSVFKFDCWLWLLLLSGKLLRAYLWWCFICSRWHMDVCNFLLEITTRPLNDRTLLERANFHPSFQKPGIDSVCKWANFSAHHAKLCSGSIRIQIAHFLKSGIVTNLVSVVLGSLILYEMEIVVLFQSMRALIPARCRTLLGNQR